MGLKLGVPPGSGSGKISVHQWRRVYCPDYLIIQKLFDNPVVCHNLYCLVPAPLLPKHSSVSRECRVGVHAPCVCLHVCVYFCAFIFIFNCGKMYNTCTLTMTLFIVVKLKVRELGLLSSDFSVVAILMGV